VTSPLESHLEDHRALRIAVYLLVAGKLVSHPTYGRLGPRWEEGGTDLPATWAEAPAG
jgi:hypothetical protein